MKTTSKIPNHEDFPKGWRWFGKLLIWFLINRNLRRTLSVERKRIPVLDDTIAVLREQLLTARQRGLVHMERVYNIGLYLLLMDRDFSVLKVDMVSTFEKWRLGYTARQMALLIYEACDDLTQMLGKDFRESLKALELSPTEMLEFATITKRLNLFKSTNHQFLYNDIRNLVSGHRAQESILFLNTVEKLEPMKIFRLASEFFEIIGQLLVFLIQVTSKMGRMDIAIKQFLASPKYIASLKSPPSE